MKTKISCCDSRSPDSAEFSHFTLLFCRGQQRKMPNSFALIVSAHRNCARKFTRQVDHASSAQSSKMKNDRAYGHCYSFTWI